MYNISLLYKALVHTQPSIVLLPNIRIFRFTDCKSEETSKICQYYNVLFTL